MSKKKGNLFEQHIDKIILGVIGLLCLYLVWALIIRNPYSPHSPGRIDEQNQNRAEELNRKLEGPLDIELPTRENMLAKFESTLDCPITDISTDPIVWIPDTPPEDIDEDRLYPVPEIITLSNVKIQPIRGAAYLPAEEVRPDKMYDMVGTELGDLDMVSVSARVDLQTLYRNFQQSFMGPRLKTTWRNAEFATPVIAQVELQRRRLLENGSWSQWQRISRPKTDPYRKQIDEIPLQTGQMDFSGGISLLVAQYRDPAKQLSLLQPRAYDFATWKVPYWLPPKYYKEYLERIQRQEDEQRRQMRNQAQPGGLGAEGGRGGNARRGRETQAPARRETPRRGGAAQGGEMLGMGGGQDADARKTARTPGPEEVLREVDKVMMNSRTKIWDESDALIWAHDDTAEPGNTYEYRMRLGVFNPIAGRNWFYPEQAQYQSQVVLWGDYSEPTKPVEIPRMLQVFPTNEIAEDPGALEVEVARYYMGKWQIHDFTVYPGQLIGSVVETRDEEQTPAARGGFAPMNMEMGTGMGTALVDTSRVDFSTNLIYLDLMPKIEWSPPPTIRPHSYSLMMYDHEAVIGGLPIGNRNWSAEMRRDYSTIKAAEREAKDMVYAPRPSSGGGMPGGEGRTMPRRSIGNFREG